jgi:hypothetical protein
MPRTLLVVAIGAIAITSLEYYWRHRSPEAVLGERWSMLDPTPTMRARFPSRA